MRSQLLSSTGIDDWMLSTTRIHAITNALLSVSSAGVAHVHMPHHIKLMICSTTHGRFFFIAHHAAAPDDCRYRATGFQSRKLHQNLHRGCMDDASSNGGKRPARSGITLPIVVDDGKQWLHPFAARNSLPRGHRCVSRLLRRHHCQATNIPFKLDRRVHRCFIHPTKEARLKTRVTNVSSS